MAGTLFLKKQHTPDQSLHDIKSDLAWHGWSISDVRFMLSTGQWRLFVPYANGYLAQLCSDEEWMSTTVFADNERIVSFYEHLTSAPSKYVDISVLGNIAVVCHYGGAPFGAYAKWISRALANNDEFWDILAGDV